MVALASLEETKRRLRIETDDDDETLDGYIEAASGAVVNYLKGRADEVISGIESGGELPSGVDVSAPVITATIMLVGYWYRNPDSDPDGDFEMGYLPKPVMALLYPLRDPALR